MPTGGEELALREGTRELHAEIGWIYAGLAQLDDARRMVAVSDTRTLDHNYLLVLQLILDVALMTGLDDLVADVAPRLLPYAGRAVINAGAVMFHGVTDDTLARAWERLGDAERARALRESALATYRRIEASWWRERLEPVATAGAARHRAVRMTLRPGLPGIWLVGTDSTETGVPARRGLEHLHLLVSNPGREIPALDLVGGPGSVDQRGTGEIIDARALAAYRRRLAEIDAELSEADVVGDVHRSSEFAAEREALLAQVAGAVGLGGRLRTAGSGAERARVTARKAIAAALEAIRAVDPAVARHLAARVRTGTRCCFNGSPRLKPGDFNLKLHPKPRREAADV